MSIKILEETKNEIVGEIEKIEENLKETIIKKSSKKYRVISIYSNWITLEDENGKPDINGTPVLPTVFTREELLRRLEHALRIEHVELMIAVHIDEIRDIGRDLRF